MTLRHGHKPDDPFAALGLVPAMDLTDDQVRAAWRRVAAQTHPDRPDGGDPDLFALAAAAYTDLRTAFGRGEALAAHGPARRMWARWGRPAELAARITVRVAIAAAAAALGYLAAGPGPAGPALVTGAATWLVVTGLPAGVGPMSRGRERAERHRS